MLQLIDCIAFSGLTGDQLEIVAIHKHIPMIVAAEWAEGAVECDEGCIEIEGIMEEEAEGAMMRCDNNCATHYRNALRDFIGDHPHGRVIH